MIKRICIYLLVLSCQVYGSEYVAGGAFQSFKGQTLTQRDFSGQNLAGADFSGANLSGVSFKNSILKGANFNGVLITSQGAFFDGADLEQAQFHNANITKISLVGSKLSSADFTGATILEADFTKSAAIGLKLDNATLGGAEKINFAGVKFTKSSFNNLKLQGGIFSGKANLLEANFSGASLIGTSFEDVDMRGAKFRPNKENQVSTLKNVKFRDMVLDQADFTKAELHKIVFEMSSPNKFSMKKAVFNEAKFHEALGFTDLIDNNQVVATNSSFRRAVFHNVSFAKIRILDRLDFTDASFDGPAASFERATFGPQPVFSGAKFTGSKFSLKLYNADMVNYRGSIFGPDKGAISFMEATVDGTDFSKAIFEWADLTRISVINNANFKGAKFINSKIASADLTADFRCTKAVHSLIQYNSFEQSTLNGSDIALGPSKNLVGDMNEPDMLDQTTDDVARLNLLPAGESYNIASSAKYAQICAVEETKSSGVNSTSQTGQLLTPPLISY